MNVAITSYIYVMASKVEGPPRCSFPSGLFILSGRTTHSYGMNTLETCHL